MPPDGVEDLGDHAAQDDRCHKLVASAFEDVDDSPQRFKRVGKFCLIEFEVDLHGRRLADGQAIHILDDRSRHGIAAEVHPAAVDGVLEAPAVRNLTVEIIGETAQTGLQLRDVGRATELVLQVQRQVVRIVELVVLEFVVVIVEGISMGIHLAP